MQASVSGLFFYNVMVKSHFDGKSRCVAYGHTLNFRNNSQCVFHILLFFD